MSLPPDMHVHTEWSWDAERGSMERTCEKAIEIGLPAIAFTDHSDFVQVHKSQHRLDPLGYLDCVERCRSRFPGLRILSGVELGEPHVFTQETRDVLAAGKFDLVLGSVHCIRVDGQFVDASTRGLLQADASEKVRAFLNETLVMVESTAAFEVLAHLDYAKRYWPHQMATYKEEDYEEEYRAVLRAAAKRGTVLEVNTTRGAEPHRGLCPGPKVIAWWAEEGGEAVSFGSDSHEPSKIAAGFKEAAAMVEAAGFKPSPDPTGFWRR